ncbi:MAG: nodulation protein NfeD [Chloroflexota bacterium]|nr:nodulation protein NfeD [Chloroflexota bacterium]
MRRWITWLVLVAWLVLALSAPASAAPREIAVLKVKGPINPVVAVYLKRAISEAESRAQAVVLQLDTPGGLDTAMRDIIQDILAARIPVVVYVSPSGARAASAGAFITMAGHVAAMAPGTVIGAAHPVASGGGELSKTMDEKVVNDAAAYIRIIAGQRGRNAEWAEKAVRESVSATDQEALKDGIIDIVAPDIPSLLEQLNGREVVLSQGRVTLNTQGLGGRELLNMEMSAIENFLYTISDPNIAYILLSLAMVGIFLELANPGSILPGVVGGIALLLAFYSLGMLPVNYVGVALIGLAFLLFLVEIWVSSHGVLAVGGVAAFILGSLVLLSTSAPYFTIDRRLIVAVSLVLGIFFAFIAALLVRDFRRRSMVGRNGLVGKLAVARTTLDPEGMVFLEGERWQATLEAGTAEKGEEVVVSKVKGLKLRVAKLEGGSRK